MDQLESADLYAAATYFTMQTLTTVGYGDIVIVRTDEQMICVFLQFLGIIFFSFASGSLTTLIANHEFTDMYNQERMLILNRLQAEFKFPNELYTSIKQQI